MAAAPLDVALPPAGASAAPAERYRVLAVDDEPNVLSALQRALRSRGYQVSTALGGEVALDTLAQQQPHVIISDMRMPGMNGAEFLKASRAHCPDAVRMLLTGYADVGSALQAVNEGEVFRYLTKPWDDAQLVAAIEEGLERHRLRAERDRLLRLTGQQNAELMQLNLSLEAKVAARTAELRQALAHNEQVHQQLKGGFAATMNVLSSLVEARAGLTRGCARRVADHVRRVAPLLGLSAAQQQDTVFAAMLVDLGKVVLPERLTQRAFMELKPDERKQWLAYPQHAHSLLMSIDTLRGAADILHELNERFDGTGVPHRLRGTAIAAGARLLAVAVDYEGLLAGAIVAAHLQPAAACQMLRATAGQRHDPQVVEMFIEALQSPTTLAPKFKRLGLGALLPGMQLAEDLLSRDGFLLLAKGHVLDEALIHKFHVHEARGDTKMTIAVAEPPQAPP